ncbi:MAG: hypothetical protein ACE5IL_17280 [Myxococcota bacterium]
MTLPPDTAGIDAGASLWKLVYPGRPLEVAILEAGDVTGTREQLAAWQPRHVALTGGGAVALRRELSAEDVRSVREFEAWGLGAPLLAKLEGLELPDRYLLVSLGTGTSMLQVADGSAQRAGGTALGGGTLLGLGRLLLGVRSFREIAELAGRGDRRKVDLLVGDIYGEGEIALPADLNASSFAKLDSQEPADLAHAVMGVLGENVALIGAVVARANGLSTAVFGGSTLRDNPTLRQILDEVSQMSGIRPLFLERGALCGAVGAAAAHS